MQKYNIDAELYDYYEQPPIQGWLRRHAGHLTLSFGIITSILATMIIAVSTDDVKLSFIYLFACFTCFIFLVISRRDIFSPIGIATIWYIFGFLLAVPFYTTSEQLNYNAPSSSVFAQTVGLSLVGLWAFAIGSISGFQRIFRPIFRWLTQIKTFLCPVGHGQFFLVFIWILLGSAIRLYFNIGRATEVSVIKIPYITGVIQFMFRDGSLLLMGLFLYRALAKSRTYILEGYILLIGIVITQLLLGWKGAVIDVFILFVIVLWYQRGEQRQRSLIWALILVVFIPITMQIGYSVRARYYTGSSLKYFESPTDFVLKAVTRFDGNTRFAKVLDYETRGRDISLTNGFKLYTLLRSGLTAMEYADLYIHKIALERKTSTGASGPGGAYIAFGLSGIVIGYFFLGAVYRSVHNLVMAFSDPTLAVVLYGLMISMLSRFFSENFGIAEFMKRLFIIAIILVFSRFFLQTKTAIYSE